MHSVDIMTVTIIGLLAVISPGPDTLIVTRNSLLYSKRVGLYTALGIALGNILWVGASLTGISYLIAKTVTAFTVIKWLGALYLIYIGIKSFGTKKPNGKMTTDTEQGRQAMTSKTAFQIGLLTNLLNPKCALFFVSFFSVVIKPETPMFWRYGFGIEISCIALAWFSLLATVLSVDKVKSFFGKFSELLERVTGTILILLGIKLALYQK